MMPAISSKIGFKGCGRRAQKTGYTIVEMLVVIFVFTLIWEVVAQSIVMIY